jgi:predicted dehydrogenase
MGTGRISDLHALGYLRDTRTRIVAVCDTVEGLAVQRGWAWGVPENRIFHDCREVLAVPEVDLVEILLPHHLNCQAMLDAAAAGKHISVEKPMAVSLEQADTMVAATGWEHSFLNSTKHRIEAYFKREQGREVLRFAPAAQQSVGEGGPVRV